MKKIIFFTLCIASIITSTIYSSNDTMVISDQTISPFIPSKEERVFLSGSAVLYLEGEITIT